jgi:hypothetical protein
MMKTLGVGQIVEWEVTGGKGIDYYSPVASKFRT